MQDLFLRIFSREGSTGREGQRKIAWVEHPSTITGWPDSDIPLWQANKGKENKVTFHFNRDMPNGIAIVCHGSMAEVWVGDNKLLGTDNPITADNGVIILPGQAVNPGGRAEIFFNQVGQTVLLAIKSNGKTVKEVNIACEAND